MTQKTVRWPLKIRILGLALLNLLLIVIVLVVFAWQGMSIESIALGLAHNRLIDVSEGFIKDLDSRTYATRDALLAAYSQRYGVDVFLVGPRGRSITETPVDLPPEVIDRLRAGPPGRNGLPGEEVPGWEEQPLALEEQREGTMRPPGPPDKLGKRGLPNDRKLVPLGGMPTELIFLTVTRQPWLYWLGVRIPTIGRNGERGLPGVLLLRTSSLFNSDLFFAWRLLLWLGLAVGAIALLCWWPFLHAITKSIRQMDRATGEIATGRFDTQVSIRRQDELGHLAEQINRMAVQLEGFVKHQKRFLGDVAHELCAPLARIQFALGILEQKSAEAQEPYVAALRDEIQEMSDLVNELLMFAKAGMQPAAAPLQSVELVPIVRNAISRQLPGTGTVEVSIPPELTVIAYEPYLLRAISNLIRNALRYAGADGPILIAAQREAAQVKLVLTDCGPGLPEEAMENVFAPLYRPESTRSRDTGGAGLGLAIVKSCIEACQGTVACRNRQPSGLEVIISLHVGDCAK